MPEKYDNIGQGYNLTRKADPYLAERLLFHLDPDSDGLYLDIGCGTGNYTINFSQKGFRFIGIDPSEKMLDVARRRAEKMDWRVGKAEDIPLGNASVEGALATLTIHHWASLEKGFSELFRVLKPGGVVVIFTSTPEQMKGYWLHRYFPVMLSRSIDQMPSLSKVTSALTAAGFEDILTEKYTVKKKLQDLFLYSGKDRPSLYLDETFRSGISSFSSLAHQQEVINGLLALDKDITSGHWDTVKQEYENDIGDYLFIGAHKP